MIASQFRSDFDSYVSDVVSGEIPACKSIKGMIKRHLKDMSRESTSEFPYHMDWGIAESVCEFFPSMLNHSIGNHMGKSFFLEPWQKFVVGSLFGWKRDEDETRRFRECYLSVGRKNGKSTLGAGLASFAAMLDVNPNTGTPENVAEVLLTATKKEQAEKVIFAELLRMRQQSQHFKSMSDAKNRQIMFPHNHATIRCIGSDRPFDGLNPHCVVMDELHEWREHHRPLYNSMITASGSRAQPILLIVTTAGDDRSYLWLDKWKYATSVAQGVIDDESMFVAAYELDENDDALDKDLWIKANPNLGVSLTESYLDQQSKPAHNDAIALNVFTRYHGNRLVSSTERAFDQAEWDACRGELSDWREALWVSGGIDLGGRDDMAAWGLTAKFATDEEDENGEPVYRYEVKSQAYIAHNTVRDLTKAPFAQWVHEGYLDRCEHPISKLRADLVNEAKKHRMWDIAYDPYNGQQLSESIQRSGIRIASFSQTCRMFHEPIGDFIAAIKSGRVTHDGNPLLRWCIGNAVAIRDPNDRWMLAKRDSSEKIDPVIAVLMSFGRVNAAPRRSKGSLVIM